MVAPIRTLRAAAATAASCAALLLAPALLHAGEPSADEKAAARTLFNEGRRMMSEGDYQAACATLERSKRIVAGPGIVFHLAECYEKLGKLASAWTHFLDVATLTRAEGQPKREQVARQRAADLEPRLSRLELVVAARPQGLVIERNGTPVPATLWDTPVPVDPGAHHVVATAPGRRPWQQDVEVRGEGRTESVRIPALEPTLGLAPVVTPPASAWSAMRIGAVSAGALGGLALVGGAIAGGVAMSNKSAVDERCPAHVGCDADVVALNDQARTAAHASTGLFVGGAVSVGVGVVLWLLAPADASSSEAAVTTAAWPIAPRALRF